MGWDAGNKQRKEQTLETSITFSKEELVFFPKHSGEKMNTDL